MDSALRRLKFKAKYSTAFGRPARRLLGKNVLMRPDGCDHQIITFRGFGKNPTVEDIVIGAQTPNGLFELVKIPWPFEQVQQLTGVDEFVHVDVECARWSQFNGDVARVSVQIANDDLYRWWYRLEEWRNEKKKSDE